MELIPGIEGQQVLLHSTDYDTWQYQYALSTYEVDHDMNPGLIVQPKNKEDIKRVIAFATKNDKAIAIRTGGHQYSGASSTGKDNIQIDLGKTFQGKDDKQYIEKGPKSFVRISVSWDLGAFNAFLGKHKVFSPHGDCGGVHLGGHSQSGGYGMLGRSFGLLGDHVQSYEIIDYAGNEKEITRENDPELFFGMAGGSPGNFGVLTHFTLEVFRDADYEGSMGLRSLHLYSQDNVKRLLEVLAEMNDNENFPRNYDLCINVLSASFDVLGYLGGLDDQVRMAHPEVFGDEGNTIWPSMILIQAQWVPFSPNDKPDMAWFKQFTDGAWFQPGVQKKPMSKLTAEWILHNAREFNLPYVKRAYITASTDLSTNGWADWVAGRVHEVIGSEREQYLSCQFQSFGGKNSRFRTNADGSTAYSWRDSTMCATMDNFHQPKEKQGAENWAKQNDQEGIGPNGIFSKQDRRLLWGCYGEFDLHNVRTCYYDTEEQYQRLQAIRRRADPHGVFTPNTFCVKRAD